MKDQPLRVLIVEDSEDDALFIIRELKKGGYNPVYERVETAAAIKKALQEKQWDIILCDYKMPKFNAPSAIAVLKNANIDIPLIIVSGTIGEDVAVECMRLGAHDFVMKDNLSRLCPAIARELEDAKVRNRQKQAESQREAALKALRESETKLQTIFDKVGTGIFIIDRDTQIITEVNQAAIEMTGLSKERIIGQICNSLVCPALAGKCPVKNLGQSIHQSERKLLHADGHQIDILKTVYLITINGRNCYLESFIDISDRKRMEEKLRSEEQRFRALAEQSSDIIVFVNREGIVAYENPAVERSLGLKAQERIGVSLFERIHPDDLKFATDAFNAFTLNTSSKDINAPVRQIRLRHKDGSWRTFEAVGSKLVHDNFVEFVIVNLRDITERKLAEETLQESEKKYRLLADNIHDVIFVMDMNLNYTYISPSVKLLRGYEPEEAMKHTPAETLTPSSIDFAMKALSEIMEMEKSEHRDINISRTFQWEMSRKDGTTVWVETKASFIRDENQRPIGIMGVTRDITDRKESEEALKQSEEKYRLLADHMKDQVWIMNLDLKVTYISPSVEKLLGYTLNEFIHLTLDKFLTSASFKSAMDFFSMEMPKALAAPSGYILTRSLELEFCCKDGHTVWEEGKFSFIRDDNGKPLSILCEARDITERKRAEETLQESEERFRSMIQSLSDIIFILDGNGQLAYESPSATRILGYQPGYFIGKSPFTHIHPDDLDQVMKDLDEVFLSVNPGIPTEFRFQKADDTWIYLEALGNNQFENPSIQGIVLTVRDITTRKQGEEKLQQTLENLRKAVGTTIQVLSTASETRDPYTAGHQKRVSDLASVIATEMGLVQEKIEGIRMAGIIHDIGKLSIPSEILVKPTKLTVIEFSLIKEHPRIGYEMLKDVESPWPLAQIVYQHHERMDGSGYPRNLKGNEILIEARIMAVADVVEAMASYRPYRPALGIEAALEEIEKNKGILYDDTVTDACLRLFREKGYQLA